MTEQSEGKFIKEAEVFDSLTDETIKLAIEKGKDTSNPDFKESIKDTIGVSRRLYLSEREKGMSEPDVLIARILDKINATRPYDKDDLTISKALTRFPLTIERLRSFGLDSYEESVLLKAVAYAAWSRDTDAGDRLLQRADIIMRHEETNINVPETPEERSLMNLELAHNQYQRALFVSIAHQEFLDRVDCEPITSIDEVIRHWDTMEMVPASEESIAMAASIGEPFNSDIEDEREDSSKFRLIQEAELQERLSGLAFITNTVREQFGPNTDVRYFDPMIFDTVDDTLDLMEFEPRLPSDREDSRKGEATQFFSSDYVIAEIVEHLDDGSTNVHIVAESPIYGNAAYVLRQDVRQSVGELIGTPLTWQAILQYPKITARQLGAQRFSHGEKTDVQQRIVEYFRSPIEDTLGRIAGVWRYDTKPIYDTALVTTRHNRLPSSIRSAVSQSSEQTDALLKQWKRFVSSAQRKLGGEVLDAVTAMSYEIEKEQLQHDLEVVQVENVSLRLRVTKLEERLRMITQVASDDNTPDMH